MLEVRCRAKEVPKVLWQWRCLNAPDQRASAIHKRVSPLRPWKVSCQVGRPVSDKADGGEGGAAEMWFERLARAPPIEDVDANILVANKGGKLLGNEGNGTERSAGKMIRRTSDVDGKSCSAFQQASLDQPWQTTCLSCPTQSTRPHEALRVLRLCKTKPIRTRRQNPILQVSPKVRGSGA